MSTRDLGLKAENQAKQFLQNLGLKYLQSNFTSPIGEIDLIFHDKNASQLVFVEVKSRDSNVYGPPELAVTPKKLYKIRRTAEYYFQNNPNLPQFGRIDVIAITQTQPPTINHFINVDL